MSKPHQVDFSKLVSAYIESSEEANVFSPASMVAHMKAHHQARQWATRSCPTGPVDWKDHFINENLGFESLDAGHIAELLRIPEWCLEPIVDQFLDLAGTPCARDSQEADAVEASIVAFILAPSEDVAKTHPVLQRIPNAVDLLGEIENARKKELATWMGGERMSPVVLTTHADTPDGLKQLLPGRLELWVSVTVDANNIECNEPDIFALTASLIHVREDGSAEPVGVMEASLIPTCVYGLEKSPEQIWEFMDAHSNQLNEAWRSIHGEFLPRSGFPDLDDFLESFDEPNYGAGSICVPWILVDERFRGHHLSATMINQIGALCSLCPTFIDQLERPIGEATEDEEAMRIESILEENPIRLFVMAIPGTPPEERRLVNPLMRESVVKDGAAVKVADAQVERRRFALTRYFQRAGSQSENYRVHVYNPYDYTPT